MSTLKQFADYMTEINSKLELLTSKASQSPDATVSDNKIATLTQELAESQKSKTELQDLVNKLQNENDDLHDDIKAARALLIKQREAMIDAGDKIAKTEDRLKSSKESYAKLKQKDVDRREKFFLIDTVHGNLKEDLAQTKNQLAALTEEARTTEAGLRQDLSDAEDLICQYQKKLASAKNKKAICENALWEFKKQVDLERVQFRKVANELAELKKAQETPLDAKRAYTAAELNAMLQKESGTQNPSTLISDFKSSMEIELEKVVDQFQDHTAAIMSKLNLNLEKTKEKEGGAGAKEAQEVVEAKPLFFGRQVCETPEMGGASVVGGAKKGRPQNNLEMYKSYSSSYSTSAKKDRDIQEIPRPVYRVYEAPAPEEGGAPNMGGAPEVGGAPVVDGAPGVGAANESSTDSWEECSSVDKGEFLVNMSESESPYDSADEEQDQ